MKMRKRELNCSPKPLIEFAERVGSSKWLHLYIGVSQNKIEKASLTFLALSFELPALQYNSDW